MESKKLENSPKIIGKRSYKEWNIEQYFENDKKVYFYLII